MFSLYRPNLFDQGIAPQMRPASVAGIVHYPKAVVLTTSAALFTAT